MLQDEKSMEKGGLTYMEASFAWISTMIGAALVGLPFAFFYLGIPLGIILNLLICFTTYNASRLYLITKDLTGGLASKSEMGYKLYGRISIFFINISVLLNCSGALILYYNIFGGIAASLFV